MAARILVVEDEQIIAADLSNKLTQMGHQVVGVAIGAEEAIAIADELRPDLVLMDVQLDGDMTGTEAASTIQDRTGAPVVYVTAFPGIFVRDPSQMRQPGICLGKPFSRIQLEAAVRAALGPSSNS
ncbi:MAG: response regulator [Bryobacteraceae bacterium]